MVSISNFFALAQRRKRKRPGIVEPYVAQYDVSRHHENKQHQLIHIILYGLVILGLLGIVTAYWDGGQGPSRIILGMEAVFLVLYLPGVYLYMRYLNREQETFVELDHRHQLVLYANDIHKKRLLFHLDQIEDCVLNMSMMLPFRLSYLTLSLKGGIQVHISSLVIDPSEIISLLSRPHRVERHWLSFIPAV